MKGKIVSFLIIAIISVSLFLSYFIDKNYSKANPVYQVYLNGNKIGLLNNDNDLYDLINEKQQEIVKKDFISICEAQDRNQEQEKVKRKGEIKYE